MRYLYWMLFQENIILKNAFSENIENYEPKLRPVNLSAKKITLINNSAENYIIPPTKPKNFDALVKQAKISELVVAAPPSAVVIILTG